MCILSLHVLPLVYACCCIDLYAYCCSELILHLLISSLFFFFNTTDKNSKPANKTRSTRPRDTETASVGDRDSSIETESTISLASMTGYYRDFIPAYASHSYHLTEATKMDSEYCYLRNCLSSSQSL